MIVANMTTRHLRDDGAREPLPHGFTVVESPFGQAIPVDHDAINDEVSIAETWCVLAGDEDLEGMIDHYHNGLSVDVA